MIVCKRPCTLYDVDLMGLAGLAGLAVAAWFLVIAPWQRLWSEYRAVSEARIAAEAGLQADIRELRAFEQGLAQIEATTTGQVDDVPRAAELATLLRQMTDIAAAERLALLNVAPQPLAREGEYLVTDIEVTARGTSHDFLRFLDRFAQANPHQSLQACTIERHPEQPDPTCQLSWMVRLYLLPAASATEGGAA